MESKEEMCGVCIGCNNSGLRHCAHADTCGGNYTIPVRLYKHIYKKAYNQALEDAAEKAKVEEVIHDNAGYMKTYRVNKQSILSLKKNEE